MCVCGYVCMCVSACLSVRPPVRPSVRPSVCLSVCLSVCPLSLAPATPFPYPAFSTRPIHPSPAGAPPQDELSSPVGPGPPKPTKEDTKSCHFQWRRDSLPEWSKGVDSSSTSSSCVGSNPTAVIFCLAPSLGPKETVNTKSDCWGDLPRSWGGPLPHPTSSWPRGDQYESLKVTVLDAASTLPMTSPRPGGKKTHTPYTRYLK